MRSATVISTAVYSAKKMSQKLFALVKWIGGEDDKKYTPDVPVTWIKDFDIEHFESDRFDPTLSYVIEWHGTKKMPNGGWPVHDGYVIAVSRSVITLRNKLKALDGLVSPKNKAFENEPDNPTETESGGSGINSSKHQSVVQSGFPSTSNEQQDRSSMNVQDPRRTRKLKSDNSKQAPEDKSKRKDGTQRNPLPISSNSESSDGEFSGVSGCARLNKKKRTSNKQLYKENTETAQDPSVLRALTSLRNEIKRMRKKRSDSSGSSTSDEDEKKEIGRRGSGVVISSAQWDTAKAAKSYTAMGISLMMSLFPVKVLLASNLRGGSSKLRGPDERPKRPALDKKIIEALYYTVQKSWKKTFNKSGLGIALNNKLTQLRSSQKKNPVVQETIE